MSSLKLPTRNRTIMFSTLNSSRPAFNYYISRRFPIYILTIVRTWPYVIVLFCHTLGLFSRTLFGGTFSVGLSSIRMLCCACTRFSKRFFQPYVCAQDSTQDLLKYMRYCILLLDATAVLIPVRLSLFI